MKASFHSLQSVFVRDIVIPAVFSGPDGKCAVDTGAVGAQEICMMKAGISRSADRDQGFPIALDLRTHTVT